jgi:hypothetical protein
MLKKKSKIIWFCLFLLCLTIGIYWVFSYWDIILTSENEKDQSSAILTYAVSEITGIKLETKVEEIPLSGELVASYAEISGLAWFEDNLILLPQYPNRMGDGEVSLIYRIPKDEIMKSLLSDPQKTIQPIPIILKGDELNWVGIKFEGFEAIVFNDRQVFLTIEARLDGVMQGYLISGSIKSDMSEIILEPESLTETPLPLDLDNMSNEALIVFDDRLYVFYEANGNLNPDSSVLVYELDLTYVGSVDLDSLEYRITDATEVDSQNRFWVINCFYPGEEFLKPEVDPLLEIFPEGISHQTSENVERLVELQYFANKINIISKPPIQLVLQSDGEGRNWEGIVRLDDYGFLLVTDKYPRTILGFIPYP